MKKGRFSTIIMFRCAILLMIIKMITTGLCSLTGVNAASSWSPSLAAAAVATTTATPRCASTLDTTQIYHLVVQSSGKALTLASKIGGNQKKKKKRAQKVVQQSLTNTAANRWRLEKVAADDDGEVYYRVVNEDSQLYLKPKKKKKGPIVAKKSAAQSKLGSKQNWCFQPMIDADEGSSSNAVYYRLVNQKTNFVMQLQKKKNRNGIKFVQRKFQANQPDQEFALMVASDTQQPSAPTGVGIKDLTCSQVTLVWQPASDNVAVVAYDIYHDGQFIQSVDAVAADNSNIMDATTLMEVRLSVLPGVRWGLYVNARDEAGNVSEASDSQVITPPVCQQDTQPPTVPPNLQGIVTGGTSVTLTWDASVDDQGVRAYDVYRDGNLVGSVNSNSADAEPATAFLDSGLQPNSSYRYTVVARDAQNNASEPSDGFDIETGAACDNSVICNVDVVAQDTDLPWGLVTLPNGLVLYNRRDAHDIIELNPETGSQRSIGTVPNVKGTDGEGGLTGLEISDNFMQDNWLYIMHSSSTDNRVVRIKYQNGSLQTDTLEILVTDIRRNKFHDGGRLRFGPLDGKLYVATGDAQDVQSSQRLDSLNGKILRMNPDGSVPADNPFAGSLIWTYGHRNPQGLAFDSQGRLWQQEFGKQVMDETNLIVKGGNYGWPDCEGTFGNCDQPGFVAPKATYSNEEASCSGIAIVNDALYVACLRGQRMFRHKIVGSDEVDAELVNRQVLLEGTYGRLRTIEPSLDGDGLWLTTSNNGDKDSIANNSDEKVLFVTLGV